MRRLQIPNDAETIAELKAERNRTKDKNVAQRIDYLLMLANGSSCYQVAQQVGRGVRTIERVAHRFIDEQDKKKAEERVKSLANLPKGYKPTVLNEEEQARVAADLRRNPREFGYNQNAWDGKLMSHHIQVTFNKQLRPRQCQRWFHRLGFRQRKPRPVIAKGDPVAQDECKKNFWS